MRYVRMLTATIAAVAAAFIVTACGAAGTGPAGGGAPQPGSQPNSASAAEHNEADISFAQGMIPHHRQAITMSRLAGDSARSDRVKDLAQQIQEAQGPEIDLMTGWLRHWGAPAPARPTGMPGMDHGDMAEEVHGMMSPQQMRQLEKASGADFDRMFLTMMIEHHEGAVAMARTELDNGHNPAAKQLAQQIIDTQQAEIRTMQDMLARG